MSRLISYGCVASVLGLLAGVAWATGVPAESVTMTKSGLVGTAADGTVLWQVRTPGPIGGYAPIGDGSALLLDNGYVIDVRGRVLCRLHGDEDRPAPPAGPRGQTCPYWSALAEVTPPSGDGQSNSHTVPFFDSQGNAWEINTFLDSGNYELQVRRSNGHDGTWGPLETISDTTNYVSGPRGAIDADDHITIVFRDIGGTYKLYAMRYEPGAGWSGPDQVYSTSAFFQAIRVAADDAGNVVVVFDPSAGATTTLWTIVYDATTGTWGTATRLTPAGYDALLPTIACSPSGDAIYMVYLVLSGGTPGLYAHRFDSSTRSWGPAQYLPGTSSATYGLATASSRFPATVNAAGELTVFWQSSAPYAVYGSRVTGGMMQSAHQLLAPSSDAADIENFAHAASTGFGDALGVLTRYEYASSSVHFYAFRYRTDTGWDAAENPYTYSDNGTTRSRIVSYRGDYSVATLLAPQDGTTQITARRYERSTWLPDALDIPQQYPSYFQEVGADRGEALLVFEGEQIFGPNFGIWGTWLRNLPGDLSGDGLVDLGDLAILLAGYYADQGGDVDGDGDTDLADLAILLANYGQVCP